MLIFLNLFFIFFKFSFTYDVIPIENFEKKIVTFNKEKDYNIYRYFIPAPQQYTTFLHKFQKIYYGHGTFIQDIYVYMIISLKLNKTAKEILLIMLHKVSFLALVAIMDFLIHFIQIKLIIL